MTPRRNHIDSLRIIALLVIIAGIAYFYLNLFFPKIIPPILRLGVIDRPINILVLGTDINYNAETGKPILEKSRTDTIMLVHFDELNNEVNILSIPRDSYVPISGYGFNKINAAYVYGETPLIKQTIEELTGIHIDKFVAINPRGIVKLVDLLGGVVVNVEKDLNYTDRAQKLFINLKQGKRKLSGIEAEGFIRFRHDASGDIGRVARQQEFLKALAVGLAKPQSILKAPFIIEIIMNNIKSDLSIKEFVLIANSARLMPIAKIKTATLPTEPGMNEAGAVLFINREEMKKIISEYF